MTDVSLDCGCTANVDHERGQRLVACDQHGIRHVITAKTHTSVTYRALRLDPADPDPTSEQETEGQCPPAST